MYHQANVYMLIVCTYPVLYVQNLCFLVFSLTYVVTKPGERVVTNVLGAMSAVEKCKKVFSVISALV